MKYIQTTTSFSAGQLSKTLEGRVDIKEYSQGCREMTNMLTMTEGGARKITGPQFKELRDVDLQNCTDTYTRFFTMSDGVEYEITIGADGLNWVFFVDNVPFFSFGKPIGYTSGDLTDYISMCSVEDNIFWCYTDGSSLPHTVRFDGGSWSYQIMFNQASSNSYYKEPVVLLEDDSVVLSNKTGATYTASLLNGEIDKYVVIGSNVYIAGTSDDGSGNTLAWGNYYRVTSIDPVLHTVELTSSATDSSGDGVLDEGTYAEFRYPIRALGFPKSCTSHEGRLYLANWGEKHDTITASKVGNPFFFANVREFFIGLGTFTGAYDGDILNTDPFLFAISGNGTYIRWMESGSVLFVGCSRKLVIGRGTEGGLLGPLNFAFDTIVDDYVDMARVVVDQFIYFSCNLGTRVRRVRYNGVNGSDLNQDLAILSRDIYEEYPVVRMEYDYATRSILALTKKTNTLLLISVSEESQVLAHSIIKLPGYMPIIDFAPSTTNNGAVFNLYTKEASWVFDLNKEYDSPSGYLSFTRDGGLQGDFKTIDLTSGGLPAYSEGDEIFVYYQDTVDPTKYHLEKFTVPASLEIVLSNQASTITHGFPIEGVICLMPVEAGQQFGTAQYGVKRVDTVLTRLYKSFSYKIKEYNSRFQDEVNVTQTTEDGVLDFTGQSEAKLSSSPSREQVICVSNDRPEPFTVLSLTLRGQSNDG